MVDQDIGFNPFAAEPREILMDVTQWVRMIKIFFLFFFDSLGVEILQITVKDLFSFLKNLFSLKTIKVRIIS